MSIFAEVTRAEAVELLMAVSKLKDAGFAKFARAFISLTAEHFRTNVEVQHHAGIAARTLGEYQPAIGFFENALTLEPDFVFTEMELATTYNEMGDNEVALIWAHRAVKSAPDYIPATMMTVALETHHGSSWRAVELLENAIRFAPSDRRLNSALGEMYCYHNRRVDAAKAFGIVVRDENADAHDHTRYLQTLSEIADYQGILDHINKLHVPGEGHAYLAAHARLALLKDGQAELASARRRELSSAWLDVTALMKFLGEAIKERRPLAFIRHGDGEARFLCATDLSIRSIIGSKSAKVIGDTIWQNWFDSPMPSDEDQLLKLRDLVLDTIADADVLGVPTADRIQKDCLHFGYLAHLNGIVAKTTADNRPRMYVDASVPASMHLVSPHLRAILAGLPFLGTVTCHRGLGPRLRSALGIHDGEDFLVPAEMRVPGRPQPIKPHFPDVFAEILGSLRVPYRGAVYVVAAGLLGKIYCRHIAKLGGIALDVGAVADAWAGVRTRDAAFGDLSAWVLPQVG